MRLTVRRMVVAAVAMVIVLAVVHSLILDAPKPVYLTVSVSVAALLGLGGIRHPRFFLAIVVALIMVLPRVYDSSAHEMFGGCVVLSWAFGALAGWTIRSFSKWRTDS